MSTTAAAIPKPIPSSSSSSMQIPQRVKNPTTGQYITLSSTPGGSVFGTTPGGTRIQYDRSSLLHYRNSPLSKSPAMIPQSIVNLGVTTDSVVVIPEEKLKKQTSDGSELNMSSSSSIANDVANGKIDDEELFEMDG